MNRFRYLGIFFLSLCSFVSFQASADELFYCYGDFYWNAYMGYWGELYGTSYTRNREDRNLKVQTILDLTSGKWGYSVAFNLTQKKIGYIDNAGKGEAWVDITHMESKGNLLVLTSSMMSFSEILPTIGTIYFDRETLNFTEIERSFSDSDLPSPPPLDAEISAGRCYTEELQEEPQ